MQESQLLGSQFTSEPTDPRYVSARPVKACDETNLDGIGTAREDDGDGRGRCFSCKRRVIASDRSDDRHLTFNQIGRQLRQALIPTLCPSVFDRQVAAFNIA